MSAGSAENDPNHEPARRSDPRSRVGATLITVIITAGIVLSGCVASGNPATGSTVDGFKLGAMAACSSPVGSVDPGALAGSCAGFPKLAAAALDAREPGHAAIVSTAMFADGSQPGPIDVTGDAPPPTPAPRHPGPDVTVFVFTLADGSTRATGVACTDAAPPSCVGVASYPN